MIRVLTHTGQVRNLIKKSQILRQQRNQQTPEMLAGLSEEEKITFIANAVPQGQKSPKRNPTSNRRPPKRLSYEARVLAHDGDKQKIERRWKLWQRAKAKRADGHK